MKNIKVKESDLEVGKEYYFEDAKINYGIFKGFLNDKTPTFEAIVNNGYGKNQETGLIEFYPMPNYKWISKQ